MNAALRKFAGRIKPIAIELGGEVLVRRNKDRASVHRWENKARRRYCTPGETVHVDLFRGEVCGSLIISHCSRDRTFLHARPLGVRADRPLIEGLGAVEHDPNITVALFDPDTVTDDTLRQVLLRIRDRIGT